MKHSYQVDVRKYKQLANPHRIAAGDVISCKAFQLGMTGLSDTEPSNLVHVAWSKHNFDIYIKMKYGVDATDKSRGAAAFLVTAVTLEECAGLEDVCVEAHLSRTIRSVRLTEEGQLEKDAERIIFNLEAPLAMTSPDPDDIVIIGYAVLPISVKP